MEYQDYPSLGYTKFTPSCVDPDGKVVSYYWEFGNGEVSKSRVGYAHYSQGGSYGVKLTVKDNSGESRTFSWNVLVTR
ncbi:MAG: PKD domain-containing protein [Candidatus Freyarchaeota archaeon]